MKYFNKILFNSILFIINSLYHNINLILQFKNYIYYLSLQNEIKEIEHYLRICENQKIIRKFKVQNKKIISIISPIYNRERFIARFLNSIQFQTFNNIEILLVDDYSIDNSVKIIEEYKKNDERIILIKNRKNKGTFVARNIGVLYAKGKYIILPDPDDIISKDIISFCYNYAEKYYYEVIRFTIYNGGKQIRHKKYIHKLGNKPVYYPKLSTYIFYGYGELEIIDRSITNKFIKSETYIKALNSLNNFYLNMHIISMEDSIINYILLTVAKSFYFTKKIGYYYLRNSISITKNTQKTDKLQIKYAFIYLKILFEYTKNTKYGKDMPNLLFSHYNKISNIAKVLSSLSSKEDLIFYNFVINLYLNCEYISYENKNNLQDFKLIIEKNLQRY